MLRGVAALTLLLLSCVTCAAVTPLQPLSAQPHLQCSACLAVAELVGHKMNESAKQRSSFQASHRLDARNKVKRIDYESSELRAHEILDGLCTQLEKDYHLRLNNDNGLRHFSKNSTHPRADFYGKNDRRELRSVSKRFKEICMEITEEQDELVISLIRTVRELAPLQEGLCFSAGFRCCGTKKVEASREKERERRSKWLSLKEKREEKRKAKEEEAARRKKVAEEEAEEARKKAERDAQAAAELSAASDAVSDLTPLPEHPSGVAGDL